MIYQRTSTSLVPPKTKDSTWSLADDLHRSTVDKTENWEWIEVESRGPAIVSDVLEFFLTTTFRKVLRRKIKPSDQSLKNLKIQFYIKGIFSTNVSRPLEGINFHSPQWTLSSISAVETRLLTHLNDKSLT